MLNVTTLAIRLSALGCSAAVHAALLLPSLGHAGTARNALSDTVTAIDVEVITDPVAETPEPEPEQAAPPAGHEHAWPTHTHPYPVPADHDATPHDPNLVHEHAAVSAPAAAPADVATSVETSTDASPHFIMPLGSGASDAHGPVSAAGGGGSVGPQEHDPTHGDDVIPEQSVGTRAGFLAGPKPEYTELARSEGVEGRVQLELVVGPSGAVESARVVRGLGHGLDSSALRAVRRFHFAPATLDGHPVHVRMAWSVQFQLTH